MVAKSYQELEQVGDIFVSAGKQYVNVRLKSGKIKSVRWYSDKEYAKMYPEEKKTAVDRSSDPYYKPQKEALGFTKGYITIFKGDTYAALPWFQQSIARYATPWGWYIISTEEVPADLPSGIEAVRLPWESVGLESGNLKSEMVIKEAINAILYEASTSEYVGSIGERLELYLTVEKSFQIENAYGISTCHIFRDDIGNAYSWITSAKCWSVGSEHHIKGTVKEHKKYKNECTTILTRCTEVK